MRLIILFITCCSFINPALNTKKVTDVVTKDKKLEKEKELSLHFKMLRSSNRVELYKSLSLSIKTKRATKVGISTKKDIINIFGEPDFKTNQNQYIYTLNSSLGCKALIEFDEAGLVNCNLMKGCN